jgi:hypothetical protein
MTPIQKELRRLERNDDPPREGVLTVDLQAICSGRADDVLRRVKEVLSQVISVRVRDPKWPQGDTWRQILPRWFVGACGPELSPEEARAWYEGWKRLSRAERVAAEERQPWSLLDWLHWFAPGNDERQWRWLRGATVGHDCLQIVIEVQGHPTAYEALVWLLRAAGAKRVWEAGTPFRRASKGTA